jgi:hypothetical protein
MELNRSKNGAFLFHRNLHLASEQWFARRGCFAVLSMTNGSNMGSCHCESHLRGNLILDLLMPNIKNSAS